MAQGLLKDDIDGRGALSAQGSCELTAVTALNNHWVQRLDKGERHER